MITIVILTGCSLVRRVMPITSIIGRIVASMPTIRSLSLRLIFSHLTPAQTIIVVFDASARFAGVAMFRLPASSGAESIEFGGELRLRFDEAPAVVAHGLVTDVRVFGRESEVGSY